MALPLPGFHFTVEWGGTNIGFSEASGLTMEIQPIEYRDGASSDFNTIKMPGLPKTANIVLKRGIVDVDKEFFEWLNKTKMNKAERRDVTISLLNEEHEPVMTWKATNCFPVKIEGPGLKATGNEVAIETLELAHEGLAILT
ncbi:MAG: phage tail protein [Thermodesulfobacteriota bacterium]|nr:phage tail protein [Thermodesulfobacteriota bacterium]MEA1934208.1 phage tail protein [Thermodesulfobacteriota bacterium]